MVPEIDYQSLENVLCNPSNQYTLAERFRALFTLKNLASDQAIDVIAKALSDESALLKHELTYCLGQIGNPYATKVLMAILQDNNEHEIVRHESAEALGAIGELEFIPILEQYLNDPSEAVRETCELAIAKIQYDNDPKNKAEREANKSAYNSVDPAPPSILSKVPSELGVQLMDTKLPLFERYRAMFALREIGTEDAVLELAKGFMDKSALFRHEIAYVFGQLQHPASVPSLTETLRNKEEVHMVRHEAAEALGSIATPEVLETLQKYEKDDERLVRESCVVALDMYKYETSGEFQYADGLEKQQQQQQNMHSLKLQ